ncbi:hypothetical protein PINS_up012836 [Pythium insidiosum]|nr:hypothetical protein PINS_up012836 [Pythium insidiosum]
MTEEAPTTETRASKRAVHDPQQQPAFYDLPPLAFRLVWLALLVLHGFCAFFYGVAGIMYRRTPGSLMDAVIQSYHIGLPIDAYPTLAAVHFAFGGLHALMGSLTLLWSLYRRRCSFGPLQEFALGAYRPSNKVASSDTNGTTASTVAVDEKPWRRRLGRLEKVAATLLSRKGVFGVEGEYFDEILTVREAVETSLQVFQAYRMAQHTARPWLNRFYLGILVVNCWSGSLLHALCHREKMKRRALTLACDLILDLMSAIGVSALIMLALYRDYDVDAGGFSYARWYDDTWAVRTTAELSVLLVTSWGDLGSRVVFSIGVLLCMESIKEILREAAGGRKEAENARVVSSASTLVASRSQSRHSSSRRRLMLSFREVDSFWVRRAFQLIHALLLAAGAVVLALHLHAESVPRLHQCIIQVHPWAKATPACLLVRLDCHYSEHNGESAHVTKEWKLLDPSSVRRLAITHCSALEMPSALQDFSNLKSLKMYNVTISRWDDDAALTGTKQPLLVTMILGRVNMTTRALPPGLLSTDFPPLLTDISFAYSNLRAVADEIATRWPRNAAFVCEVCEFTSIPTGVANIPEPQWLGFARNPLAVFPFELLSSPNLQVLNLNEIMFPSLQPPDPNVFANSRVGVLNLQNTNITYLPQWVDAFVSRPRDVWYTAPLHLSGTPFCAALAELQAGTRSQFPDEWLHGVPAGSYSSFMYLRPENASALDGLIECGVEGTFFYPTVEEDQRYSLTHA